MVSRAQLMVASAALVRTATCWVLPIHAGGGMVFSRGGLRVSSSVQEMSSGDRSSAAVKQQEGRSKEKEIRLELNPPRGTRDFYPEDMRLRQWLFNEWRKTSEKYGFEEIDAPVLENEAIYIRKAGEEVTQQLYSFEDKGGRRVSLRPEMTPSIARMVAAKRNALSLPLKWYSIPQCWRYERMTRGRRREHYQWNMDIFGVAGVEAEAELLAAVVHFFRAVGLGPHQVGIKLNSRKVLASLIQQKANINHLEEPARFAAACVLVDKLDKVPVDALYNDFADIGIKSDDVDALVAAMTATTLQDDDPALTELRRLFELAEAYGFRDYLVFDATIVRGLAYYTGLVFEGFDRDGELRAICGGGRYDNLLSSMYPKVQDLPAVGLGFGDAVIIELLKDKNLLPENIAPPADVLAFPIILSDNSDQQNKLTEAAATVAASLRANTRANVDLVLEPKKPKWAFKHADRRGARFVAMLAPDEWFSDENLVVLKDLQSGEQMSIPFAQLDDHLSTALSTSPP